MKGDDQSLSQCCTFMKMDILNKILGVIMQKACFPIIFKESKHEC